MSKMSPMFPIVLFAVLAIHIVKASPRIVLLSSPTRDPTAELERLRSEPPSPSNLILLTDDTPIPQYLRDYSVIPVNGFPVNLRPRFRRRRLRPNGRRRVVTPTEDKPNDVVTESPLESGNIIYPVAIPLGEYPPGWQQGLRFIPPNPAASFGFPAGNVLVRPEAVQIPPTVSRQDDQVPIPIGGNAVSSVPELVVDGQPVRVEQPVALPPPALLPGISPTVPNVDLLESENDIRPPVDNSASPYLFGYIVNDGQGSIQHREESADDDGVVTGSYGYRDNMGLYRIVNYIADENGFRVKIKSNEPGMDFHTSSDDDDDDDDNVTQSQTLEQAEERSR